MSAQPPTAGTLPTHFEWSAKLPELPEITDDEEFGAMVEKIIVYVQATVDGGHPSDHVQHGSSNLRLQPLVSYLGEQVHHPAAVAALLAGRYHFSEREDDEHGANEARGQACEVVAWRLLAHMSETERIDSLFYQLPPRGHGQHDQHRPPADPERASISPPHASSAAGETTSLLTRAVDAAPAGPLARRWTANLWRSREDGDDEDEANAAVRFAGLNALEIAAVADAKKFLSRKSVQKIVNDIWNGHVVFWESLSVKSRKRAHLYNKRLADPYCRLRVPLYMKIFESCFFTSFLILYYLCLIERDVSQISAVEILLWIWIAAFAYDEWSQYRDAGTLFYSADFWSLWDMGIIGVGVAYVIARIVGVVQDDDGITDVSFDILSLEALFLVPRICSLLSLHPYFGTLLPCLKEMTKDFVKFLSIVVILYIGFLTTFSMLARDRFSLSEMSWILIQVFFGSSYLGFDIMREISPILGPPLMLTFVCMTNILLITVLISLLSNRLTKVMEHARSAVFVLEVRLEPLASRATAKGGCIDE
ncbi:MAG: hypothetical protein M1838_001245 [Thelocarpon superellum]|nr:MAG: hypothetical protein M1838_001245 [Thelocarpon superellum]